VKNQGVSSLSWRATLMTCKGKMQHASTWFTQGALNGGESK